MIRTLHQIQGLTQQDIIVVNSEPAQTSENLWWTWKRRDQNRHREHNVLCPKYLKLTCTQYSRESGQQKIMLPHEKHPNASHMYCSRNCIIDHLPSYLVGCLGREQYTFISSTQWMSIKSHAIHSMRWNRTASIVNSQYLSIFFIHTCHMCFKTFVDSRNAKIFYVLFLW